MFDEIPISDQEFLLIKMRSKFRSPEIVIDKKSKTIIDSYYQKDIDHIEKEFDQFQNRFIDKSKK